MTAALAELLRIAAIDICPFAEIPPVVRDTTRAGRLRHPSWHRLRPDLAPGNLT
ncbi:MULTISPECIES: hypothetical protein [unclassified Streptomyces]|uniref:hypothetical protein n=1 Tax=unclassified Streptomyces TaxID=2593676 RepID=UPI0037B28381